MSKHLLKPRSDVHLARKIWHFLGVIAVAVFYHNLERPLAIQTLTIVSAIAIFVDVFRQRSEALNKVVLFLLHPVMRDSEKHGLAGSTYMLIGVLITVVLFPPNIVTLALFFLAVADPIASYFGIRYGRDPLFKGKSLQGSLAAFVACTIVAAGYFYAHNLMTERIVIVSVLAGLVGAVAEAVPIGRVDDNLILPVVSSCLLWVLYFVFGGF